MLCQICHRREGTERIVISGASKRKVCICRVCEEQQMSAQARARQALSPTTAPLQPKTLPKLTCKECGWTTQDYEETKMLGCPICYEAFAPLIADEVRRCQPSSVHVGKSPETEKAARGDEYEHLRKQLDRAVKEERFVDAAALKKLLDRVKGGKSC